MRDRLGVVVALVRDRYSVQVNLQRLRDQVALMDEMPAEAAEDEVIHQEVISKLPPRLVHEKRNTWAYFEAEVTEPIDPASVCHDELSTIHWYDRADLATVDSPEPVGIPGDYRGVDPIEDVALPPRMAWSGPDKKAALEEEIRVYGIEPGQWFDLEWPPSAHLWDPGIVFQTDFTPCGVHAELDGDEECPECQDSVQDVVEQMAQWKWTTTLRINAIAFDDDGRERSTEVHVEQGYEVATTDQDPREVLIGPPDRDRHW